MSSLRVLGLLLGALALGACGDDDVQPPDASSPDAPVDALVIDAAPVDAAPGPGCTAPGAITPGTPISATTAGAGALSVVEPSLPCGPSAGPEAVYSYATTGVSDLIWTVNAEFDSVSYIRGDCATTSVPDVHCDDETTTVETVEWPNAPAGTYFFIVDGYASDESGSFTATLTVRSIVAVGGDCSAANTRCDDSSVCDSGTCVAAASYCATHDIAALDPGVELSGSTSDAADLLECPTRISGGNDEYYSFTAPSAGKYSVLVVATDGHDVVSYTTSNCTLGRLAATCYGALPQVTYDLDLAAGETTYIVVDGVDSGAYTVRVDAVTDLATGASCASADPRTSRCPASAPCTPGGTCAAATPEVEANNTTATANALPASGLISAAYSGGDVDHFAVTLAAGQTLVAETLASGGAAPDTILSVVADDGTTVLLSNDDDGMDPCGTCSTLAFTATTAGVHYLRVAPAGTSSASYLLRVYLITATAVSETEGNDSSPGNTLGGASLVAAGFSTTADSDFFHLALLPGRRLLLQTSGRNGATCATADTRLDLYDPTGATVEFDADIDAPGNVCSLAIMGAPALAAGTYVVRVTDEGTTTFDYGLHVLPLLP